MASTETEVVVLGGGCFWCIEAVFKMLRGVIAVDSGYAGGEVKNPTFEQVHGGKTGHVEVVRVKFNPEEVSFRELLEVFFSAHDPTTVNRQGNDIGEQYKSIIFYTSKDQERQAKEYIKELENKGEYDNPIVTELKMLDKFYEAGQDHKDYFARNPEQAYCQVVIAPKVEKVSKKYRSLLK